jgi:NADH-quinone oxidoreductase subunit G
MPAKSPPETITITLDGRPVEAYKGEMIIAAAERAGVYIPRFCYHPRMKPVGMCRMCLVDVKGPRGFALSPACFIAVADGQEVVTNSPAVKKAQDGILEFLLINHPLDCPVCDKGGECPLQDQTLAYGPGETRFVEEKRHWDKPIALSPLVLLDRERCIQCARCTRFADEVAGDPLIDFAMRGDSIEVATFPDEPFSSYFSGNTVQICPVGALTSVPYRFKARPWDLEQVESSCTSCSMGCRVAVQSSSDQITRYLGIDSDPVNQSWLCDKGRFDFQAVNSEARLTHPLVRQGDGFVQATWAEALELVARALGDIRQAHGGSAIGVIGGARLPNEDAYAWSKLARTVLSTDNVDAQLGDGLDPTAVLGLPRATINQATQASAVVLLGPDLKEEVPVLYLRLRQAVIDGGLPIVELSPHRSGMTRHTVASLSYRPGEAAVLARALAGSGNPTRPVAGVPVAEITAARRLLSDAMDKGGPEADIVVVLGRPSMAEHDAQVIEAAGILAGLAPGRVSFLSALRRSNVHGALDMGLAPGVLPGRVTLSDGRSWYEHHWDTELADQPGLDTAGMLQAAVDGQVRALVLLGADPAQDFPDRRLATQALDTASFVVAVDCFATDSTSRADVILPVASYAERPGTFTNLEGRISRLGQKVTAPGVSWPDWIVAAELAFRMGGDLGFDHLDAIWDEIEHVAPAHAGLTKAVLSSRRAKDGVVVPLGAGSFGVIPGTGRPGGGPALFDLATDSSGVEQDVPAPIDPMADPGISSAETHGIPATMSFNPGGAPAPPAAVSSDTDKPVAGEEPNESGPLRPALLKFQATGASKVPPVDQYSLRLVANRTLWDGGTLVQRSPHLAGPHPEPRLRVNPAELDRLGVASGDQVRVVSPRGALVIDAIADRAVPQGIASVYFGLPGPGPADLIDVSRPVTDVRLETV